MSAPRWSGSLRARVLALAALAACPGLLIAALDTAASLQHAEGSARLSLSSTLDRANHAYIDVSGDAASDLAVAASSLSDPVAGCPDALRALAQQHPEYENVGLASEEGEVFCSLSRSGVPSYPVDHGALRRAINSPGHPVTSLVADRVAAAPRLVVAHAKRSRESSRRFVAFISMAFPAVLDGAVAPLIHDARLFFVDTAGSLVQAEGDPAAYLDAALRDYLLGLSKGMSVQAPGVVRIDRMGEQLVASLPLGERGETGSMAIAIPRSVLYQGAWDALLRNMSLMAAGLLAVMLLTWWMGHRLILSPTQKLLEAMNRLARGDLRARAGLAPGTDEIARLGMALDRMAGDIEAQAAERIGHLKSLERRNRLHAMQAAINAAILLRPGVNLLLDEICRLAFEVGQFSPAWVGEVDEERKTLRAISWAGAHVQLIAGLRMPLDTGTPAAGSPSGTAASEGVVAVSNRYLADPNTAYWHHLGRQLGIHSAAAFPIGFTVDGRRRTLTLCVDREDYFEAEEIELLEQLAHDVAFGLHMIATEQTLAHTRTHDATTGLPNHVLLAQHLDEALHRAASTHLSLAVAVLEIGYQQLVSQWGAHRADGLFKWVGETIRAQSGDDDFVGILPGARFAIVMGNLDSTDTAERKIETLSRLLSASRVTQPSEFVALVPRFGIAVFPDDGHDPQLLLDKAQTALAHGQDGDHEAVHFYAPAISLRLQANRRLEQQLYSAISSDQLALHYQPIIDLASGQLHGFEALLRWNHPDLGHVPPDRFIPLAESSGLILPIGDRVVSMAAAQALAWQRAGASNLVITLNVSAVQMRDKGFGERIRRLLAGAGQELAAVRLALEITESQIVADIDASASLLADIKACGLGIIIDDFGTGYSSLSYLHHLPADALKIDRSFTASIDSNRKAAMIVQGIFALARSLEVATVAEGIERAEQIDRIRGMGCTYAQGFWFDRALTAQAAEQKWIVRSLA